MPEADRQLYEWVEVVGQSDRCWAAGTDDATTKAGAGTAGGSGPDRREHKPRDSVQYDNDGDGSNATRTVMVLVLRRCKSVSDSDRRARVTAVMNDGGGELREATQLRLWRENHLQPITAFHRPASQSLCQAAFISDRESFQAVGLGLSRCLVFDRPLLFLVYLMQGE